MTPALLQFARRLGGEAGMAIIGLPDGPSVDGIPQIDDDRARGVAEAARSGHLADPDALATWFALIPEDLGKRTIIVSAGMTPGWQFPDLLDLVPHLVAGAARVVVLARPSSIASTPEKLGAMLRERGVDPIAIGLIPASDPLAPRCPMAIIDRQADRSEDATAGAIVRCGDDAAAVMHTVRSLAAQGIAVTLVDEDASGISATLAGEQGVSSVHPPGDRDAAAAALGTDWVLDLAAGERLDSPLPGLPVQRILGIASALGHDAINATTIDIGPPLDGHEPGTSCWRFATDADAFHRVVATRSGTAGASPSPYNLLLVRPRAMLTRESPGVMPEPLASLEERGEALVERLSGFGAFALAHPTPTGLRWHIEETVVSWHGNVLKAGIGRLPYPDPMDPGPGACLIRWDSLDGAPASLMVTRGDGPERFLGRGGSGTITIDGLLPGVQEVLRLVADGPRRAVLGELRIWFDFEPGL